MIKETFKGRIRTITKRSGGNESCGITIPFFLMENKRLINGKKYQVTIEEINEEEENEMIRIELK